MNGAPWNGLFYLATLQFLLAVAGLAVAASTEDPLWRTLGFAALVAGVVLLVRTVRSAAAAQHRRS
jgi:positive regulator of sigma E activity